MQKILLVEPSFPYPSKSKNKANSVHKNFVPVGLLKLGAYYKSVGAQVQLIRGNCAKSEIAFEPNLILVTSIFTYWSGYVWSAISYYRELFPKADITLGGIYATLHADKRYFKKKCEELRVTVYTGLHKEAEKFYPDYSLLNGEMDHHVTHAMRGCIRRCPFCGTWKIEPDRRDKTPEGLITELKTIKKNKVIFFDNNFFANQYIKEILVVLASLRINKRPVICESQSGFDGRLLEKEPELASLLKQAHFQSVRIAWDNSISDAPSIEHQIELLVQTGYPTKDISVFMIYNYSPTYETMLEKLDYCKRWGVQITDCRFRPLDSISDGYKPKMKKGEAPEYYIHSKSGWTDEKVHAFRKKVREHNIWVRYAKDKGLKYSKKMEQWSAIHTVFKFFKMGRPPQLEVIMQSPTWKTRIEMMKRICNAYKKQGIASPDFTSMNSGEIDHKLKQICDNL